MCPPGIPLPCDLPCPGVRQLREVELEGSQSLYQMTYGGQYRDLGKDPAGGRMTIGIKCPVNKKGVQDAHPCRMAYDNTYYNTFQLVKKLREEGGGGTTVYEVAPHVRSVERDHRIRDEAAHMGSNHETDYPRSNVTGTSHPLTGVPNWVGDLQETWQDEAIGWATKKLQGRQYEGIEKMKKKGGRNRPPSVHGPGNALSTTLCNGMRQAIRTRSRPTSAFGRDTQRDWVSAVSKSRPGSAMNTRRSGRSSVFPGGRVK